MSYTESDNADEELMTDDTEENGETMSMEPIPAPNPSYIPAVSPERMQQIGGMTSTGLARIGNYLESPDGGGSNGSSYSSTREANGDDLSDLFEGPDDTDLDIQIDDLVDVDDEDIFGDGGEDMSDLTDVPDDMFDIGDITGYDYSNKRRASGGITRRVVRSGGSPAGMGGMY
jgi:hypothetical protein